MKFIPVTERYSDPQDIDEPCNNYYTVKLKGYPNERAMFLRNKKGECGWYINYIAKIIVPVTHWLIEDDN